MKNRKFDIQILIWIDSKLKDEIKKWCYENNTNSSQATRQLWIDHLRKEEIKKLN